MSKGSPKNSPDEELSTSCVLYAKDNKLVKDDIKRDPTAVELFDIAQSNSERSRHYFLMGRMVFDGKPMEGPFMQNVKITLEAKRNNSVFGFQDKPLRPTQPGSTSQLSPTTPNLDVLFKVS